MGIKFDVLNLLIDHHSTTNNIPNNKFLLKFINLCNEYTLTRKNKYLLQIHKLLLITPKHLMYYIWYPLSKLCDNETYDNMNNMKWTIKKIKTLHTATKFDNVFIGNVVFITIHNINNNISKFCINLLNNKLL
ncbi:Myristylated protein [Eptesipox virus]|uniref:Myristylated protein n=1 Tax=Eptesipox virus TaxID=1329402 RepID=A0A220T6J6_9POXV|nr:Myristylated protein [Eptesipox virus]ASK51339.1 Myristylated protein [Eptesipox virus]WAH71097.1 myristylated protein [Eptesipox virus]